MKFLIIFCLCSVLNNIIAKAQKAQMAIPSYSSQDTVLFIPSYLPWVSDDSAATLRNDTLIYRVKGQMFGIHEFKLMPDQNFKTLATPWETIVEMADAYAKKNKDRIISLYSDNSKKEIDSILKSNASERFLDYISEAVYSNLRVLGGIEYQGGYMVFTRDDLYGVHENYIVKENGKYKLSALHDNSPTAWNIGLYLKYDPKPILPITNITLPDSLKSSDSVKVTIQIPQSDWWVAVYSGKPREIFRVLIQDNGPKDLNPLKNQVSFYLKGDIFLGPGNYTFYIAAFNYPVLRISENFLIDQAKHNIKIY